MTIEKLFIRDMNQLINSNYKIYMTMEKSLFPCFECQSHHSSCFANANSAHDSHKAAWHRLISKGSPYF